MGIVIFAAMLFLAACGSSAGPSSAPNTSQPPASPPSISAISPSSGPTSGGTTVTITGVNFQKGVTVTFGGVAAPSVTFASSTKLTATSPKGNAGAAAVAVTNPDGQMDSLTSGFTYLDSGSGGGGGGLSGSPGATATQYVLTYTTSTNKMCTIEVSRNQSFTPLVHAVDPSIFVGSDSDGQTNVGQRTFVVGERTIAAETDTAPSITVGAGNATRAPLKYSGYTTGAVTVTYSGQPFVAGDNIIVSGMSDSSFDSTWARVMSASANSFTYWTPATAAGSSGGGTIKRSDHYSLALENNSTYYYRIGGPNNTCGASPAEGTFTTMNWPNGDTFAENFPTGSAGKPIMPTVFETHDVTKNSVIDPITGTLVRPLSLFSDNDTPFFGTFTGSENHCSYQTDSNGYFHCYVLSNGGGSFMYAVKPSDGSTVFLGELYQGNGSVCGGVVVSATADLFDSSDPNVLYTTCQDATNNSSYDLVKLTYTGNDVSASPGAYAPLTVNSVIHGLATAVNTYDSAFNPLQIHVVEMFGVQSHYGVLTILRYNQNSPAWTVVVDLSSSSVIAAATSWANGLGAACDTGTNSCTNFPMGRWAGQHGSLPLQLDQGWASYSIGTLEGSGSMGPFEMTLNQSSLGGTDTQDTITVTSTPVASCPPGLNCGSAGDPMSVEVPPDGSTFLDIARPGDIFKFTNTGEYVMVLVRNSPTSLTVARGCHMQQSPWQPVCDGTGEAANSSGATLSAVNWQSDSSFNPWNGYSVIWNFQNDPHAQDRTGSYLAVDRSFSTGHGSQNYPWWVSNNWWIKKGSGLYTMSFLTSGPQYYISQTPSFAGMTTQCSGAMCQGYPHYDANPAVNFFWDTDYNVGGAYGNGHDSSALVNGTTYIYKYSLDSADGHIFYPQMPYRSVAGGTPNSAGQPHNLVEISAPGAMLTDTAADNWKYCVAYQAGECWTGSSAGDIYANLAFSPNSSTLSCQGGDAVPSGDDWCVENAKPAADGLEQISFLPANRLGTYNGQPLYGWGGSRKLIQGLGGPWRHIFGAPQDLLDQSWAYFSSPMSNPYFETAPANMGDGAIEALYQNYLVKVPPQPPDDGIDRTTYENVPVAVGAGSNGATHARVKYGYQEDGQVNNFYCTQYKKTCYYSDQNLPLNGTVNIPVGTPQRVIFYQVEYLDSSENMVATGPVTAYAIP